MRSINPTVSSQEIKSILQTSSDDVNFDTHPGWDRYIGYGRINALKACLLADGGGHMKIHADNPDTLVDTITWYYTPAEAFNKNLYIDNGVTCIIKPNVDMPLVSNAKFIVEDGGKLVLENNAEVKFQGSGNELVVNGDLELKTTLTIPDGATLVLNSTGNIIFSGGSGLVINGKLELNNSLTIPSSYTLTLNAGAEVEVLAHPYWARNNKYKIQVYGKIQAAGADGNHVYIHSTTPDSGLEDWYGIKFQGQSGSYIRRCTIKNAYCGIHNWYCGSNTPDIAHSKFTKNSVGIFVKGSSFSGNNNIRYNASNGNIYKGLSLIYLDGSVNIYHNQFSNNSQYGVFLHDASPYFWNNKIQSNTIRGVYSRNSALPKFGTDSGGDGNNKMTSNDSCAVYTESSSYPNFGGDTNYGNNCINALNGFEIDNNSGPGTIYAQRCYWGSGATWDGNVDHSDPLVSCGLSRPNPMGMIIPPRPNRTASMEAIEEENIWKAKLILENTPDDPEADRALSLLVSAYRTLNNKSELLLYLNQLADTCPNGYIAWRAKEAYINNSLTLENAKGIVRQYEELLPTAPNTDRRRNALFNIGYICSDEAADSLKAAQYFDMFKSEFPGDPLIKEIDFINGNLSALQPTQPDPQERPGMENETEAKLNQFSLDQNYPNPFNTSTTIKFSLAADTPVKLSVYNIKGQAVRVLVDQRMVAGAHKVTWNGKDQTGKEVPSGLYFYRFAAGAFKKTKSMLYLK
jgi:outer membrane protein assembly factor BamD (BamD/ComL family)